ncbi:MAG: cytochrome-c oxidase [Bacteroidetes bacterium]|jgi:cytochrome c oxidase cbb3-type subunit 2|nr:cytochrome-c oxidase [Bacteroidota bacterium]
MIRASVLFIGSLAAILMSFVALSVFPSVQLMEIEPTEGRIDYNFAESQGRQVYMREGCIYCHTQQVRPDGFGTDIARGWGTRGSEPGDYAYDFPHLLGTMRTGPDLADIGQRQPSRDWHLAHFYNPRSVSPGSLMPSFPYLFEIKDEAEVLAGDVTVTVSEEFAPDEGVIVAKEDVLNLYAYLMTLKQDPTN